MDPPLDDSDLGDVSPSEREALRCLAAAPAVLTPSLVGLEPGVKITPDLTLEEHLGTGAMGTVFVAWDARLERRVAVKIHLDGSQADYARLEREARSLAKVTHPNVLMVHDVGMTHERLFVSMEYVAGETLAAWSEREHSWVEVVEVYAAAGRGLAAAHGAGLVHRDFKPSNVLLGEDGRVRVADFGLAKPTGTATTGGNEAERVQDGESITRTGAAAGTPAFMAPEQFAGEAIAASDQFALCVAIVESLTGARPYGESLSLRAKDEDLSWSGPRGDVPRCLRPALRRGLSLDPEGRHASVSDLVAALERELPDPGRRLRRALWLTSSVAVVGLGVALTSPPSESRCDDPAALAEVWNDARRDELAAAFAAVDGSAEVDAWSPLSGRVGAFAATWGEMRAEVCREARETRAWSDAQMEQAMACFDRARVGLDGVLTALEQVDAAGLSTAWQVVPDPAELASCRDRDQLDQWTQRSPASLSIAHDLAYAGALRTLGHGERADAVLTEAAATAVGRDASLTALQRAAWEGQQAEARGELALAANLLEQTFFLAEREGHAAFRGRVALGLAYLELIHRRDLGAARVWLRIAAGGELSVRDQSRLVWLRAILAEEGGDPRAAIALVEAALEEPEAHGVASRLSMLDALSTAYDAAGELEKSLAACDEALALARSTSGESSTDSYLSNRGLVLSRLGRHHEAIASHREAIERFSATHGSRMADANGLTLNLALALSNAGRSEDALELLPQVLAETKRVYGEEHGDVALALEVRGEAHGALGRWEEALADMHAASVIGRRFHGPHHSITARYLYGVGHAERMLGRSADALRTLRLAAMMLYDVGELETELGREAAVEVAELTAELGGDGLEVWIERARTGGRFPELDARVEAVAAVDPE